MILPLMLLVLVLLGMMAASGSFFVHADMSATRSAARRQQTRLAAEAGLEKVKLFLRDNRLDMAAWYDNAEQFHRVILWTDTEQLEEYGSIEEYEDEQRIVYRFSIVADNPDDDEVLVRYGVTDEAGKVNINTAPAEQLVALITPFIDEEDEWTAEQIVDAILDWRDSDIQPRPFGAEAEYYSLLETPYAVKNAEFDTVEELLLVRGMTADLLYGEDVDRNGLLSPNEDDGELIFPDDNQDGLLNRGLYPHLTVYSRDFNTAADNTARVYLFGDPATVTAQLSAVAASPNQADFIVSVAASTPRITSLGQLMDARTAQDGGSQASPITIADMGWVTERISLSPEPDQYGLININSAPPIVLQSLPGLEEEDVLLLLEARAELPQEDRTNLGWVASIVGKEKFTRIAPLLTVRPMRFHVESVGYADHFGTMTRLEAILEMRGPVAQIIYLRDLTNLGTSYPVQYPVGDEELVGYTR